MRDILVMPLLNGRLYLKWSPQGQSHMRASELFVEDLICSCSILSCFPSSSQGCALSMLTEMLQEICRIMLSSRPLPSRPHEGPCWTSGNVGRLT